MIKFTVLLVVVAACISSSVAFQCYVCESTKSDNCMDVNNITFNQNCPVISSGEISKRGSGNCMQMYYMVNGTKHVKRACETNSSMEDLCDGDGDGIEGLDYQVCYNCDNDLCNGSGQWPIQDWNSFDESSLTSTGSSTVEMWMTLIPAIVTVAIIKYSF